MTTMYPNRNINYDTDFDYDLGLYDDLEGVCVTGVTGLPDNMDYHAYAPSVDSQWSTRSSYDFYIDQRGFDTISTIGFN